MGVGREGAEPDVGTRRAGLGGREGWSLMLAQKGRPVGEARGAELGPGCSLTGFVGVAPRYSPRAHSRGEPCALRGQAGRTERSRLWAHPAILGAVSPLTLPRVWPAESCVHVVCPRPQSCVVDQTGSAHCVMCRSAPCPAPTIPGQELCGNNNVTYISSCHLRQATCFLGRSIGVRHPGSCAGEAGPVGNANLRAGSAQALLLPALQALARSSRRSSLRRRTSCELQQHRLAFEAVPLIYCHSSRI